MTANDTTPGSSGETISACERWAALTDRQAVGDSLSNEEARFVGTHARDCALCAAEAQLYSDLSSVLHGGNLDAEGVHGERGEREPASPIEEPAEPARSPVWPWVAGVAAAAAAAIVVVASPTEKPPSRAPLTEKPVVPTELDPVRMALVAGDVRVSGSPLLAGSSLHTGDALSVATGQACIDQGMRSTSCFDAGTTAKLRRHGIEHRQVYLDRGRVVCRIDEKHEGRTFSVSTRAGTVTATGTVFAVAASAESVEVRLHRGSVLVETRDGKKRHLSAPAAVTLGGELPSLEWDDETAAGDLVLIAPANMWAEAPLSPLTIEAAAPGATISLDDTQLGAPPVSVLTAPGAHSLLVRAPDREAYAHTVRLAEGGTVVRPSLQRAPVEPTGAASSARKPQESAATELLRRAQDLRSEGRLNEAAAEYRKLVDRHASAPEAQAALLSLGHLELGALGQPAQALQHFERYLAGGGRLSQEASYARIQALRRLGREQQAAQATRSFLRSYPDSAQATALRQQGKAAK